MGCRHDDRRRQAQRIQRQDSRGGAPEIRKGALRTGATRRLAHHWISRTPNAETIPCELARDSEAASPRGKHLAATPLSCYPAHNTGAWVDAAPPVVSTARVQALYAAKLVEGLSTTTVHHLHSTLHRALEQAVRNSGLWCGTSPTWSTLHASQTLSSMSSLQRRRASCWMWRPASVWRRSMC